MALRLYDYSLSGSCYKVRLLLGFLELSYEREQVDFYPGRSHKSLDFLEINPLGQIPDFQDGDLRLRDAQAILCHLANKYDKTGQWLPRDPDKFGTVMMWLMFGFRFFMVWDRLIRIIRRIICSMGRMVIFITSGGFSM